MINIIRWWVIEICSEIYRKLLDLVLILEFPTTSNHMLLAILPLCTVCMCINLNTEFN